MIAYGERSIESGARKGKPGFATLMLHCRTGMLWKCVRITSSGRRGQLIGSLAYILPVLGRGTGPRGEKMAGACPGTDSQDLATILDPFRAIFADLGPDRLSET